VYQKTRVFFNKTKFSWQTSFFIGLKKKFRKTLKIKNMLQKIPCKLSRRNRERGKKDKGWVLFEIVKERVLLIDWQRLHRKENMIFILQLMAVLNKVHKMLFIKWTPLHSAKMEQLYLSFDLCSQYDWSDHRNLVKKLFLC
jgi:hypothetical protein